MKLNAFRRRLPLSLRIDPPFVPAAAAFSDSLLTMTTSDLPLRTFENH
jgi:hypothetical protein